MRNIRIDGSTESHFVQCGVTFAIISARQERMEGGIAGFTEVFERALTGSFYSEKDLRNSCVFLLKWRRTLKKVIMSRLSIKIERRKLL